MGEYMKILKVKFITYVCISIFVFSSVFGCYVQSVNAASEVIYTLQKYFYLALTLFDGDLMTPDMFNAFYEEYQTQLEAIRYTENPDGTITFSEEALKQLRDLFDEYLAENPEVVDVAWMPVISSDDLPADWFYSASIYNQYRANTDNKAYSYVYCNRLQTVPDGLQVALLYTDVSDYWLSVTGGSSNATYIFNVIDRFVDAWGTSSSVSFLDHLSFYTSGGLSAFAEVYAAYNIKNGTELVLAQEARSASPTIIYPFNTYVLGVSTSNFNTGFYVRGCNTDAAAFVPVFRDRAAMVKWMTGQGNYYRFDSGYTGGDITINPDADYDKIYDAIKDVLRQGVANGDTMAKLLSSMQTTFKKELDEISGTLGDINEGVGQTNTWLEKIYQLLQNQQNELQNYFSASGKSLDDLIGLLSHTGADGKTTSVYTLLADLLVLFRVQQEDLQAYMDDVRQHMKTFPFEIYAWISAATRDIKDAIQDVVDAVKDLTVEIKYGDYINGDQTNESGESLWTQLGKGLAKILTSMLNLLKILIFDGFDLLYYFVDVLDDNLFDVFSGIGIYFDAYISYIEENTFFPQFTKILPDELLTIIVLSMFSIGVAGVIKYFKRG